jgi:LPS sulfotransferase NodH
MLVSCVICTLPRSGSWLLAEALNNTGLVGQPEEYFRPDHMPLWNSRWGLDGTDPYDEFVRAAVKYSTTTNGVFSVKMHWYQFEWFVDRLHDLEQGKFGGRTDELIARWIPNPRYILLLRHDKPRQAVSYWRADRHNSWFVETAGEAPNVTDLDLEPDDASPDFERIRSLERALIRDERCWLEFFEDHGLRPLTVIYEHFVANYASTVVTILDWLEVRRPVHLVLPPPGLKRQADDTTESILEAYRAVRHRL